MTAGGRAAVALTVAPKLRTVSLTNFPIEHINAKSKRMRESIIDYVEMFAPLLTSLHTSLQTSGQGADVLNVLKISRRLPGDKPHGREKRCQDRWSCGNACVWHRSDKPVYHLSESDCSEMCKKACEQYRERYEYLQAALRKEIATQLGLATPSQDDEE